MRMCLLGITRLQENLSRPGEHCAHRSGRVAAGVQQIQSASPIGQFGDQGGQGDGGAGVGELGGDPQRQRQSRALLRQRRRRLRVGVDPVAEQCPEKADGLVPGQQVEVQPDGTVAGHQPGQRVAAGHDHYAAWAPGEHWPYLVG
jgi:hypothetical protein